MYLLLGDPDDQVCKSILASLELRGREARIIASPMLSPMRIAWRFDTSSSASRLIWKDGSYLSDNEIEGVLVRRKGHVSSDGWNPADLRYMQTETSAALLAWLWSLDCPVVNRFPAALWFSPNPPLLFWQLRLEQCGLRTLPSLISNVELDSRCFGRDSRGEVVYAPLTAEARYRLDSGGHWHQLAAIQRHLPVHLSQVPTEVQFICIVGSRVVWDGSAPEDAEVLEPAFSRFSAVAGIAFVELTTTFTAEGTRVAAVNPYPCFERFGRAAQHEIAARLVQLLTGERGSHEWESTTPPLRSKT